MNQGRTIKTIVLFLEAYNSRKKVIKLFQVTECHHRKIRFAPRIEEEEDMQEERSDTTNRKEEMQKYKRKLSFDLVKKMYPSSFRNWPILNLLKPEFVIQIRMVMVYGNGGNRALIVTRDKNVYTLDYNKDDHLKINDTHIGLYPKEITELCGKKIRTFTCNSAFVLALTEEGEVYSWKFSEFESDKRSLIPNMQPTPTRVMFKECIVDIACGSYHSLALTSDGQVYAWGDNSYGQVGIQKLYDDDSYKRLGIHKPRESDYNQIPNKVAVPNLISKLKEKNVVSIACGSKFNMVVTGEGKLYGWGDNKSGQINYTFVMNGSNLYKHYAHPIEINVNDKVIVKVACGFEHTLVLTDEGKVYAWGNNDKGQIGVNNNLSFSSVTMVDISELVLDIGASANFSVAVGTNETIYVWGDCFDQKITSPFLTGLSTIHDAFAYSRMKFMHKPMAILDSDLEEVLNILKSLELPLNVLGLTFDDPSTSDCIIEVEGQHIHVHKAILQFRCQHFKNKFQYDWTENNDSKLDLSVYIVLEEISYIVYKAFLNYLYTGTIDLSLKKTLELMILADKYGETSLKKKCNQIVEQAITPSNVAFFYSKAIEYKVKEFEEFCFYFAFRHMKDLLKL
ncbi:RCC1 and BTB domain-containing protein 1-like isoform X2 [Nylanderia fulva]|uniref:RCC1 and BTB domain-containing protein 1-like isoform X2 n=1 Tax=Nylanderia fulva TaxID=613905 RepID=UPI0010FB754C|nr:RCC1 and BTB domain-containing protein 1-like isoform X2 [Nylanderia fulva]